MALLALTGKVVAISGAGRGIGRAVALECARQGAAVVVNDAGGSLRGDPDAADCAGEVVGEITRMGGRAITNTANVADRNGGAAIVADAMRAFGRIDAVVCNAGISRDGLFHKLSLDDWHAVIDVHLNGSFHLARAAAPFFREQMSGSCIFMTSASGLIGNLAQSNYCTAKLALVALSNAIAIDMERFGVRSNCVAPFAWSRMGESIPSETPEQRRRIDVLKAIEPSDNAPLVAFLCSDLAKDVSGQVFAMRKNEAFLFSPSRPARSIVRTEGWTVESIATDLLPYFAPSFSPLEVSADVFSWDPV
jgi:NAD(P)-dependent dehydrogenase (short-subunit alcohol dehydrogenase family)